MRRIPWVIGVLFLAPLCTIAQTAAPDQHEQEVRELRARVEQLEKIVAELQKDKEAKATVSVKQLASEPAPAQAAEPGASAMAVEHTGTAAGSANPAERRYPSLHFRGFGGGDFGATADKTTKSGFNMGQLILHMSSPFAEKRTV